MFNLSKKLHKSQIIVMNVIFRTIYNSFMVTFVCISSLLGSAGENNMHARTNASDHKGNQQTPHNAGQFAFTTLFWHLSPTFLEAQLHVFSFPFQGKINGSVLSWQQFRHVAGHASLTPATFEHLHGVDLLVTQSLHLLAFVHPLSPGLTAINLDVASEQPAVGTQFPQVFWQLANQAPLLSLHLDKSSATQSHSPGTALESVQNGNISSSHSFWV